jgi:AcrR family transcriptional regulator
LVRPHSGTSRRVDGVGDPICYRSAMTKPLAPKSPTTVSAPKTRTTKTNPPSALPADTKPAPPPARAAKIPASAPASNPPKIKAKAKAKRNTPKVVIASAPPVRKRREQQRAIDTKQTILDAALSEFAQVGFEAASIRNIAASTGLQHPLITYHYRTKEILWKAVAENAFAQIRSLWDEGIPDQENMTPIERLRAEYSAFLRFTVAFPDFHHFMLRESRPGNPRLPWLVETILSPTMQRLLPQIHSAQDRGDLPEGNPVLIHYMMIGMTSVLSSLKDEIQQIAGIATDDQKVVDAYLGMIDALVFRPSKPLAPSAKRKAAPARKSKVPPARP